MAAQLRVSVDHLVLVAENTANYYREWNQDVKGKVRHLLMADKPLAVLQRRILDHILCRLPVSPHAFGAIRGRSIRENAAVHAKAPFAVKLDIRDFYPSIRYQKVYNFFIEQECSPDVAKLMTQLTTWRYALPLGVSTSPFLADQIVSAVDSRIAGMANKLALKYSRYVDDITISGDFELEHIAEMVIRVIRQAGFRIKRSKLEIYQPGDGKERIITGVRVEDGRLSAPRTYVEKLHDELIEAWQQSLHQTVQGQFDAREQYRGRIGYVMWLDPDAGEKLLRIYRKVKWGHIGWAQRQQKEP